MKSKEEIIEHLAHTVYSHGARKTICGYLVGVGIELSEVRFAERRRSEREAKAATFDDFISFALSNDISEEIEDISEESVNEIVRQLESIGMNICREHIINGITIETDNFRIGDCVKYTPSTGESSTEYVEAIAHDAEGNTFLCLSNGEYVKPCYCSKYRLQGAKRRRFIDKLNEVI